jgi:hypothetical protein
MMLHGNEPGVGVRGELTHGRDTHQRCTHAGVQPAAQPVPRDAPAHDVNGGRVDAALGGLQADLDEVEGVADDDGADAAEAAGGQGAQLRPGGGGGGHDLLLDVGGGLGRAGERVGEGRGQLIEGLVDGLAGVEGRHCCCRKG